MDSFSLQLAEEVESYERLKRGQFSEIENLHGLGRLLIGLRIARNLSQRELADKLGVHESQVSRDERNEYHGVTVRRAAAIHLLALTPAQLLENCALAGSKVCCRSVQLPVNPPAELSTSLKRTKPLLGRGLLRARGLVQQRTKATHRCRRW